MKQFILFSVLMAMTTVNVQAQLKVDSTGHVSMTRNLSVGGDAVMKSGLRVRGDVYMNSGLKVNGPVDFSLTNSTKPTLSIGNDDYFMNGSIGLFATSKVKDNSKNIGVEGFVKANSSFSSDANYGVLGVTTINTTHGRNYGVAGILSLPEITSSMGGAGIYAADYQYLYSYPENIPGIYAAYFHGSTYMSGPVYTNSLFYPADERLNKNVSSMDVASKGEESTLDKLLRLNVTEYSAKNQQVARTSTNNEGMTSEERVIYEYMKKNEEQMNNRRRFGLSGQELQKIYPDLVVEGQDGYLYVNYIELVPILIRSIQELKAELNEMKGGNGSVRMVKKENGEDAAQENTGISKEVTTSIIVPLNLNGQSIGVKRVKK